MKHWGYFLFTFMSVLGCDSVALQVEEVHIVDLQPLTPYIESNTDRYTLKLLAPELSNEIRTFSSTQFQPSLRAYDVDPFEFRSQEFDNDFEMTVVLDRLVAVEPGESVELYFEIENIHGHFQMYASVEFY